MGKDRCAVGLLQALCSVLRLEDERCRAHNTGVFTFRGEPDKGLYVRVRAPRKTLKPIASPLDQDSAVLHHATRKHNALRREKLLGNLAAYGKPAGRIVAHGLHHRIARFSGVVHGEACQAIYIPTGETMDYVRWFRSRRLTAAPGDSWPGSQRFQTAMHAAVAERPSRTNENVTDFAGRSLPSHHPSGIYDAAADARANGNIHQILHILARAEHKFAPGARIRVIRDNTRQIVPLLQERNKRQVSPTDVDRRNRNAPVAINRAGNGNTNGARPLGRLREQVVDDSANALHDRVMGILYDRPACRRQHVAAIVHNTHSDFSAANVYADSRHGYYPGENSGARYTTLPPIIVSIT